MLNFLSSKLRLGEKLDKLEVFDPLLDLDSNYFINIRRLKEATTPEFIGSYEKINKKFEQIGKLLASSSGKDHRLFREAYKLFDFPEVNGICLGYSNSEYGSSFGPKLRQQIIEDAKQIIDAGVSDPEIFHLVGLFEKNVGPDRLSDMISSIIKSDIELYTRRINSELNITKTRYKGFEFKDGLIINPFKRSPVLLLPKEILHDLPIAKDWNDIDRVCKEIDVIRNEVNEIIGKKWSKMGSNVKKDFLKDLFLEKPQILRNIIDKYRIVSVDPYDFVNDKSGEYVVAKIADSIPDNFPIKVDRANKSAYDIALIICNKFKDLVENNKVSELLYVNGVPRNEKIVQRAFFCVADSYCNAFDIGISVETDSGRGPVDFKFETGYSERTLVEIKLASSDNLVHGMEIQIQEYAKAEKTTKLIYLVIDYGGAHRKINTLNEFYLNNKDKVGCPQLVIIDAVPKKSASKYKPKED